VWVWVVFDSHLSRLFVLVWAGRILVLVVAQTSSCDVAQFWSHVLDFSPWICFVLSACGFDFPSFPVQYSQDDQNDKGQQSVPNESLPGGIVFVCRAMGVAQPPIVTVQP